VADLPAELLLELADELARRWIVALLRTRPLEAIGELPLAELARQAPALCMQVVRALQSEGELARLVEQGGRESQGSPSAQHIPAIVAATDAEALVQAVEALRGVLWEALLERLSEPSVREVGDLADRLAYVCAAALGAAVAASDPEGGVAPAESEPSAGAPAGPALRTAHGGSGAGDTSAARGGAQARIVDELAGGPPVQASTSPRMHAGEIEIRDERGTEGPAAWIGSIGARLEQFARDRLPFAVLLVELVEGERLSQGAGVASLDRFERELGAVLGARGSLTRERPGRYWLVMADTDRGAAQHLAERVARAVEAGATDAAAPLRVAVGVAVCPDDGHEASTLAAHADVGLYADRSAVRAARRRGAPVV
jgi:GGDEF domain-containing protein